MGTMPQLIFWDSNQISITGTLSITSTFANYFTRDRSVNGVFGLGASNEGLDEDRYKREQRGWIELLAVNRRRNTRAAPHYGGTTLMNKLLCAKEIYKCGSCHTLVQYMIVAIGHTTRPRGHKLYLHTANTHTHKPRGS